MLESVIQQVKDMSLFRSMSTQDISSALACVGAYTRRYLKSEYIITNEATVKNIGLIMSGAVQMVQEDMWGNKSVLVTLKCNEIFGESFACGGSLMSTVSFVAVKDMEVMFLPFARVIRSCQNACGHHQKLIENMVTLIAEKNVMLMEKLDILSKKTLREKLLEYLSVQAGDDHKRTITIPLGRVQLAEYLCVDRSALTRELNNMKSEGIIDFDKNTFRILKFN